MKATSLIILVVLLVAVTIAQTPAPPATQTPTPAPPTGPGPTTGRGAATNQSDAAFQHPASEQPGVEYSALHEDPTTGALDMFMRYPAGYVVPTHWHSANERMILIEGKLQLEVAGKQRSLDPGGYAFLPAREIQKMSCVSKTRCVVFSTWDGKFDNRKNLQ